MTKESNITDLDVPTLKAIEDIVFFANSVPEVSRDLDAMYFDWLRSPDADNYEKRNSLTTSYFQAKMTFEVIYSKTHPNEVTDVALHMQI